MRDPESGRRGVTGVRAPIEADGLAKPAPGRRRRGAGAGSGLGSRGGGIEKLTGEKKACGEIGKGAGRWGADDTHWPAPVTDFFTVDSGFFYGPLGF